jgi:anti-anti-sigma factor
LRIHTFERTAIIRVEDADDLFAESAVRAVRDHLHRLIEDGHTRLLVNLAEVQHLSGAMLGVLAALRRKLDPVEGRIQLCGLSPLLRDMLRITGLDRVFEIYGDEAAALALAVVV